jgi:hypothetical protein
MLKTKMSTLATEMVKPDKNGQSCMLIKYQKIQLQENLFQNLASRRTRTSILSQLCHQEDTYKEQILPRSQSRLEMPTQLAQPLVSSKSSSSITRLELSNVRELTTTFKLNQMVLVNPSELLVSTADGGLSSDMKDNTSSTPEERHLMSLKAKISRTKKLLLITNTTVPTKSGRLST